MSEPLLTVSHLKKYFSASRRLFAANTSDTVKAVDDVSFTISAGETVGLVGESGCGKTTTAMLILRLYEPTSGTIKLDGVDIDDMSGGRSDVYRTSVQAVFQDPYSSLSPRLLVRDIIAEPLIANTTMSRREIDERVNEVVAAVGLPPDTPKLYPHEFSGGQRQRIALARALTLRPKLIVLDEPLSALDVSIKAQVMNLLKDLQENFGVAYLLIAHDLASVRYMSDWVGVMYLGKIVESGPAEAIFSEPLHPYTQALMSAALPATPGEQKQEIVLQGEVPSPINIPSGCPFHPRCFRAMKVCSEQVPEFREIAGDHKVSCHLYDGVPATAAMSQGGHTVAGPSTPP